MLLEMGISPRTHRLEALPPSNSAQAFVALSGSPEAGKKLKGFRQRLKCSFCGINGHTEDKCFKRINQQLQSKPSQANAVQEVPRLDSGIVQFAAVQVFVPFILPIPYRPSNSMLMLIGKQTQG
ncbi:hypothetical protein EW146_g3805 [Bondarzewia mesenterica]|uniref:Uncharacterized protein n=1 Tax=Bondarzewia mesenterica TaxID=1095465 RepID=A0A4S4M298_9AGAM|nr:hypothetical protein EW146_g3805 [Bondarzewia mesenterica]